MGALASLPRIARGKVTVAGQRRTFTGLPPSHPWLAGHGCTSAGTLFDCASWEHYSTLTTCCQTPAAAPFVTVAPAYTTLPWLLRGTRRRTRCRGETAVARAAAPPSDPGATLLRTLRSDRAMPSHRLCCRRPRLGPRPLPAQRALAARHISECRGPISRTGRRPTPSTGRRAATR